MYKSIALAVLVAAPVLGAVFNVTAYRAVGNGTSDDTAAISAAINAAGLVNGVVYLPCGTYLTSRALAIAFPMTIKGEREGCAWIQPAPGPSFDIFDVTSSNVTFQELTINANATGGSGSGPNGITLTGTPLSNITLDRVTVTNAATWGVTWGNLANSAVTGLYITRSTITGSGKAEVGGITTGTLSASDIVLENSAFGSNKTSPAILATGAHVAVYIGTNGEGSLSHIRVVNNKIAYPSLSSGSQESDGIVVSTGGRAGASISNVVITGNSIEEMIREAPVNGNAIELWGVSGATVTGNAISNDYQGVVLRMGEQGSPCNGTVAGNTINSPLSPYIQINLGPGCRASASNNVIDSQTWGIALSGSGQTAVGNTINLESLSSAAIETNCEEASGCQGAVISSNVINGAGRGIFFNASTTGHTAVIITGNSITNGTYGIASYDTVSSGKIAGTVTSKVTTPYFHLPPGVVVTAQ